ncbi:hypothetical protein UY3_03205 [Chelonia mydas]|uniref:Uncharacterized protein n=1 Tax=Chelonia mydas TaxID=8469 RepID=M7BQW2_CHEMY|nr:hypothetical protein UY3_03205 [Chelonia mydas]
MNEEDLVKMAEDGGRKETQRKAEEATDGLHQRECWTHTPVMANLNDKAEHLRCVGKLRKLRLNAEE